MKLNWRNEDRDCVGLYVGQCRIGCVEAYADDEVYRAWLETGPEQDSPILSAVTTRDGCKAALEAAARRALENDEILEPDELAAMLNGDKP